MKKGGFVILIAILALAAVLRFSGTFPGYPPYHSDEGISYSAATSMLKNGNLDPLRYDYPALVPLVNLLSYKVFFIPLSFAKFYATNVGDIVDGFLRLPLTGDQYDRVFQLEILGVREVNALGWSRALTALFGLGSVALVYKVGSRLYDLRTGIFSAFLLAINYRSVLNSHLGLPDIYNAFFLLLALFAAIRLLHGCSRRNYILAGISIGLSLSVKYQFFSAIPFLLIYGKIVMRDRKWSFTKLFLAGATALFVFILLNPYALVKIEETRAWLIFVASKYRVGRFELDYFPYSYLYKFGIGKLTSLAVLLGGVIAMFQKKFETTVLLSIIIPFLFVTTYYTGGGFYTRNFVTITPFLLLLSGYFLSLSIKKKYTALLVLPLFLFASNDTLSKSFVVAKEYRYQWNFQVLSDWVESNIPQNSKVSAHSSVPLPIEGVVRLDYEIPDSYSLEEFREDGADFAITNLDWVQNDFYWWMTDSSKEFPRYWNKPVYILEKTYPALTIKEIQSYTIFSAFKSWEAPESSFIVSVIPEFTFKERKILYNENFSKNTGEWQRYASQPDDMKNKNMAYVDGKLWIRSGSYKSKIIRWKSKLIDVRGISGVKVTARIGVDEGNSFRDGFLVLEFVGDSGTILTRLTPRVSPLDVLSEKEIITQVPSGSTYLQMYFQSYDPNQHTVFLDEVVVMGGEVELGTRGKKLIKINVDNNMLYPNSHGNL